MSVVMLCFSYMVLFSFSFSLNVHLKMCFAKTHLDGQDVRQDVP